MAHEAERAEGAKAFRSGARERSNPYQSDRPLRARTLRRLRHDAWLAGWHEAADEAAGIVDAIVKGEY